MARASASKGKARGIVRGSGNVFADLGLPYAEERQTKLRWLAREADGMERATDGPAGKAD